MSRLPSLASRLGWRALSALTLALGIVLLLVALLVARG